MQFTTILEIIKALGKEPMMELVKSKWVQFCVGGAILLISSPGFIRALAAALK
jgi:hypothetical protein